MNDTPELELTPPYAAMADLYTDVERNLEILLEAHAQEGLVPTCRKGCDACCHQLVMTTMAEAREAARGMRDLPSDRREVVGARLDRWHGETADLRARLQEGVDEELEPLVDELAAEYWRRRVPCPFLMEGACAIYAHRPLICRHHFSLSEPARCAEGDGEHVERMEAMDEAFFFAQDAVPEDEAEIGIFPELVALALGEDA